MTGKCITLHSQSLERSVRSKRFQTYAFQQCGEQKWSRQVRQFGGLAKVDPGCFYAASCSVISAVA